MMAIMITITQTSDDLSMTVLTHIHFCESATLPFWLPSLMAITTTINSGHHDYHHWWPNLNVFLAITDGNHDYHHWEPNLQAFLAITDGHHDYHHMWWPSLETFVSPLLYPCDYHHWWPSQLPSLMVITIIITDGNHDCHHWW